MTIWFDKNVSLESLKAFGKGTMTEHLGVEWVELGKDFFKAKMPVDHRTLQPLGLLHGGASCVLAETIGSVASHLVIDPSEFYPVGIEINANHIRSTRKGTVKGKAFPLHIGNSTQVWSIEIKDEEERLVCISRITMAVLEIRN